MPMRAYLCACTHTYLYVDMCGIVYRLSRVWSRRLVGKLHHTWETGSSLPAGADYCTHGGPVVYARRGPDKLHYEVVYGTERYVRDTSIVTSTYDRRIFSCTGNNVLASFASPYEMVRKRQA